MGEPYNPLDKLRLGESVAKALLTRSIESLPPAAFPGAGIYALYYTGEFLPYAKIVAKNLRGQWSAPIYVGKAVPPGARKGGYGLGEASGEVLFRRLREHGESILVSGLVIGPTFEVLFRRAMLTGIWLFHKPPGGDRFLSGHRHPSVSGPAVGHTHRIRSQIS